jgi:cyclase
MTKKVSIIPCLDTREGRVVKGVRFVDLVDVGDPAEAARRYEEQGADELVFLDITATIEGRATRLDIMRRAAAGVKIPICVGGGIRTVEDMQELFDAGISKVSISTAAVHNPGLIREAAAKFGSERLVVAIDVRKFPGEENRWEVLINGGSKGTGMNAVEWAKKCQELGAGALLPTSKDTDGVKTGYDLPMTRAIAEAVTIPVIASGGAGTLRHMLEAVTAGKASAVLAASVFHFGELTVKQVKEYFNNHGITTG